MAIGGSFWTEELLLKTNLQIFRTYEAEAICFLGHNKKSNPIFYVHEGVYVLHVCIEVVSIVGKSNKMDRRIHEVT
jgi:hypothetical protein